MNSEPVESDFPADVSWTGSGIGGFDYERAADVLLIPSEYSIEAMAAIGVQESPKALSPEMQEREAPSDRKPLNDIVSEGAFDGTAYGGDE